MKTNFIFLGGFNATENSKQKISAVYISSKELLMQWEMQDIANIVPSSHLKVIIPIEFVYNCSTSHWII